MINIKRFIDRVSAMDARSTKDLILSAGEARLLRDEIAKLLADKVEEQRNKVPDVQKVAVSGGRW